MTSKACLEAKLTLADCLKALLSLILAFLSSRREFPYKVLNAMIKVIYNTLRDRLLNCFLAILRCTNSFSTLLNQLLAECSV